MSDQCFRFLLRERGVRAVGVRLKVPYQTVLERGDYPPTVARWLGEALAAAALFAEHLKLEGALSLQLQSSAALRLLFAENLGEGRLRGLARLGEGDLAELPGRAQGGLLAINIRTLRGEPWQGIVAVDQSRLDRCCEVYFEQSEQLATALRLVADGERAAGLLLQRLPGSEADAAGWSALRATLDVLDDATLLGSDPITLMETQFADQRVELLGARDLCFACPCSRARVDGMLRSLGVDEVEAALAETGTLTVHCEFCNAAYAYGAPEAAALFAG
ncbi:MAG: Hsp33 family molecular chaperone HslO [Xanthomonadales bacterium]|jgi:molecular chaperone Hsp33|nr:Hsp33 family molecular chaperone HslO [Xanthomonadales bacterium]